MTQQRQRPSPTAAVARRTRELRARRGWSAAMLARKCAEIGVPELNRSVIANIESGRRKYVTVDEAFALACVLEVALVHLLLPTEVDKGYEDEWYLIDPSRAVPIPAAREWVRGNYPAGADPRVYFAEVPRDEWQPRVEAFQATAWTHTATGSTAWTHTADNSAGVSDEAETEPDRAAEGDVKGVDLGQRPGPAEGGDDGGA